MKKQIVLAACAALFAVTATPSLARRGAGAPPPVSAPSIDSRVASAFATYPNGGEGLQSALETLLGQDPTLADDIRAAMATASPGQRLAAQAALESTQHAGGAGPTGGAPINPNFTSGGFGGGGGGIGGGLPFYQPAPVSPNK